MTIEIIPNWHPVLVHFTIGLYATSCILFLIGSLCYAIRLPLSELTLRTAHFNLWLGAIITVATIITGWDAYNTVAHDGESHNAMAVHRNWALATAGLFLVIALWSLVKYHRNIQVSFLFLVTVILAFVLLAITGYKGSELVYRHGLGVIQSSSSISIESESLEQKMNTQDELDSEKDNKDEDYDDHYDDGHTH